jgi:dipeptidyl aminopeptidase/acylaminoacyl peptidase
MKKILLLNVILLSLIFISNVVAADDTELERSVAMMAKIGSCYSPTFSPDGKKIAFVSNLNGIPQIWVVDSNGGWPQLVTALDDQIQSVDWSPDGLWLAFSLAPGGGMNQQIYVIHPDGSGLQRLTAGGKDNNWLGSWSHNGRLLLFASNERSGEAMDAYTIEPSGKSKRIAAKNEGIGYFVDISRDESEGLLYRMRNRGSDDLYLINIATGKEVHLTPHEGPGSFENGVISPDAKTIYLSSNKDRDLVGFARIQMSSSGDPGAISIIAERKDGELQEFRVNEQGTVAALLWNIGGRNDLSFIDLQTLKTTDAPVLPAEIGSGLVWTRDGSELAMSLSGAAMPADIWVLNRNTNKYRQVTFSPHAGIDLTTLIRPELVKFKAEDGLELSGWLYRPKTTKGPGPVVISFHGGPEGQEQPSFRSNYQALLSRGIAVFAPNVRGSSGFGKKFVNLDNGALRVNAVKDIKSCVDYVVQAGIADPKRIGIMGGSYGGYMVMAGLTEYPDLFAAGADLFGVVNFETFFAHTEPWMAAISKVEYGDPDKEVEMLKKLSPIHNVDKVKAATIVLHGANDTNVPVVEAEQVVDNLKKRGIPVKYVLFPDEGHGFQKIPNRIKSTVETVNWFVKYLQQ